MNKLLVFVRIFHKNMDLAVLKSCMYCSELRDIAFLRAYLCGLVLTLTID